ncbi:class C sortase [Olsenella uli]
MKKHLSTILLAFALLVGMGLLVYPSASDWWNSFHQSQAIAGYIRQVESNPDEENQAIWDAAVAYNQGLDTSDGRFVLSSEEKEVYEGMLDVTGTGIMGYVSIPKISVSLPIYHGTDDTVLQIAIGHIPGSSLPVGGEGTHTVISGHRGLPSARLFTDIDQLAEGDHFVLHVLGRTLTYEIDQILTVPPDDLDALGIEEGQDLCTLVTCTPYGVNTHRLLVRGHRVPNDPEPSDGDVRTIGCLPFVGALAGAGLVILVTTGLARRKRGKPHDGPRHARRMGRR